MLDLNKPLLHATIGDLTEALTMILKDNNLEKEGEVTSAQKHYVYGIAGIAQLFGCSVPTAQRIKSSGVIDEAVSQVNGIIVVDSELALDLLKISKKYRNISLRKSKK